MENALISVLVPVYNVEQYLPRCIDSVLAQTYRNMEIVLVNDGSSDKSGLICEQYVEKDERVKVYHQDNRGVAAARNTALSVATGEYIIFVDADDYIPRTAVADMYLRLCRDGSDMVIVKHAAVYDTAEEDGSYCEWMKDEISTAEELFWKLAEGKTIWPGLWGKMMKREILHGLVVPDLCCGEDLWMLPQIIFRCHLISLQDKTLYYYYQREESIVHQLTESRRRDDLKAVINMVRHMMEKGIYIGAKRFYKLAIERAFGMKDRNAGLAVIREGIQDDVHKKLMSGQNVKVRIMWHSLQHPWIYWCIIQWKKIKDLWRSWSWKSQEFSSHGDIDVDMTE